ncbi:hypothetical protein PAXINDRAFT_18165 [Paxillus involutus ATCC 200175]|uniref:Uncharacterized protein n=1 Tax=Paxillus involutus ATCC 200175 TaxID=664439 RepID=A0A0C9TNC3_PAXIN|nr:hypothetical protein PAXINDRAFT_18165 [Paxillus involutus ATCC 200175]
MAEIPALRTDGQNWPTWRANLEAALEELGISAYLSQTTPNPYDEQVNALAKSQECFKTLKNLFEKSTATTRVLEDTLSYRTTKREATYGLETVNNRVHTCKVGVTSRRDDDQHPLSMPMGNEEPGKSRKEVKTAARGPGRSATDQGASSVNLAVASHEKDSLKTNIDTPKPPPSPPTTPSLLFEQTAPTSRQPTHQRSRNGHVLHNRTRHTHEDDDDDEGSRGRAELRSSGYRETNDDDSSDVDIHCVYVVPQEPHTVSQMALDKAADTSNPNAMSAGMTMPVGTSNGPLNGSSKVEGEGGKGEGNERARGIVAPSLNGKNAIPDSIPPAPNPDERGPPPSMPLEGEKNSQQSSGHSDEMGMHQVETPRHKSTTQQPRRTPYNQRLNGEDRGVAVGHREAAGARDEVGERDEAKDDEEDREDKGRPNEGEERQTVVTNANDEDDTPPEPPPPPPAPPAPPYPER